MTEAQLLNRLQAAAQETPPPAAGGVKVTVHRHQPAPLTPEFVDECMEVAEQARTGGPECDAASPAAGSWPSSS